MNANGPCITDFKPGDSIPSFDPGLDSPDPTDSVAPDPTDTPSPSLLPDVSNMPTPGDTTLYPVPPACTDVNSWAQRNCTLYLLLIGGDAGIGRGTGYNPNNPDSLIDLRTDTMILLQADLSTGRSAMYSIPRNLMNVPLGKTDWNAYPYHFFPARIDYGASPKLGCGNPNKNQQDCIIDFMWHDAAFVNPGKYPYPGNYFARATMAVQESIGALTGVNISGTVVVDLIGFVDLINALVPNGLTINSPYDVHQLPGIVYTDSNNKRIYNLDFPQGTQTLGGEMALAFARLRHVVGHDSDVYRMARQQLVLTALLNQVNACELAPNVTGILNAVKGTIWTNLDWNDAPQLAAVVAKIKPGNVKTYGLTPSKGFAANVTPNVGDNSVVKIYQRGVQLGLNGAAAAYTSASGGGGGGFHC
jgi:LCP family protein required for cell wall assembly